MNKKIVFSFFLLAALLLLVTVVSAQTDIKDVFSGDTFFENLWFVISNLSNFVQQLITNYESTRYLIDGLLFAVLFIAIAIYSLKRFWGQNRTTTAVATVVGLALTLSMLLFEQQTGWNLGKIGGIPAFIFASIFGVVMYGAALRFTESKWLAASWTYFGIYLALTGSMPELFNWLKQTTPAIDSIMLIAFWFVTGVIVVTGLWAGWNRLSEARAGGGPGEEGIKGGPHAPAGGAAAVAAAEEAHISERCFREAMAINNKIRGNDFAEARRLTEIAFGKRRTYRWYVGGPMVKGLSALRGKERRKFKELLADRDLLLEALSTHPIDKADAITKANGLMAKISTFAPRGSTLRTSGHL